MPIKLKRPSATSSPSKASSGSKKPALKRSKLDIFDIPLDKLVPSKENPQEMDDATFDELVEGIKIEGVDEPIQVVPIYEDDGKTQTGTYMIISGHHRTKGAKAAGLKVIPAVVKPKMDDAARKIALVRRNQLRGKMNSKKFTDLFREVANEVGNETAKRLMGFTKEAAFKKVYEDVSKSLPSGARKQLDDAKETVKSVDDLSSILNGIFRKEGSKATKSYMVFSYGGKEHHYFTVDKQMSKVLKDLEAKMDREGKSATQVFLEAMPHLAGPSVEPKKRKVIRRGKDSKP